MKMAPETFYTRIASVLVVRAHLTDEMAIFRARRKRNAGPTAQ